jgi:hypothetical protein
LKKKSRKQEKKDFMKNLVDDQHEESVCDICDLKLSPMQTVKTHMRIHHMKHSQTQTDDASYDDKGSQSEETHSTLDKIVQTSEGAQKYYRTGPLIGPSSLRALSRN